MLLLTELAGCRTLREGSSELRLSFVTDSSHVTVYDRGNAYVGNIAYTLTNTTNQPISRSGCGGPGYPDLEKKVSNRWVVAYDNISLACRTHPDFSWDPGSQIRDVLRFTAFKPGHNTYPQIRVDSIDGTYRLRWSFTEGRQEGAKGARSIEAVSNEFLITSSS